MRHALSVLFASVALATAAPLAAQTTWIVDWNNGPGTSFTDLPPAIQAAQTGDKILVRTGAYTGGTITEGIWILAEHGATVTVSPPSGADEALVISGLPDRQIVVVQGLQNGGSIFNPVYPDGFLRADNCSGPVVIADCSVSWINASAQQRSPRAFTAISCAHVSIHGANVSEALALVANGSNVVVTDSSLQGQDGVGGFGNLYPGTVSILATNSSVTVSRSFVDGGSEGGFFGPPGKPAIQTNGGELIISGSTSTIAAGTGGTQIPAIAARTLPPPVATTVVVDPRATLTSTGGAPAVDPTHSLTIHPVPSMSGASTPPGGTLEIDLEASAGDITEIYLGLPWGPIPGFWPDSGNIWVKFGAVAVLGRFTVPANEHVSLSLPIPDHPFFQGFPFTFQAITVSLQNGFRFSTPVTPVLN